MFFITYSNAHEVALIIIIISVSRHFYNRINSNFKSIIVYISPSNRAMYNESLVKRFVKLGVAWSERSCSKYISLNLNITIKLYINYCVVYKIQKNILLM